MSSILYDTTFLTCIANVKLKNKNYMMRNVKNLLFFKFGKLNFAILYKLQTYHKFKLPTLIIIIIKCFVS